MRALLLCFIAITAATKSPQQAKPSPQLAKSPQYTKSPQPHPSRLPVPSSVLSPRILPRSITPKPSPTASSLPRRLVEPPTNIRPAFVGIASIIVLAVAATTILWCRKVRYRSPVAPVNEPRLPLYTSSLSRTSSASSFNPGTDNWPRSRFANQTVKGCNSPV